MQLRKFIRILNEMIEKDPSLAYKELTVNTQWAINNKSLSFIAPNEDDIHLNSCVWEPTSTETENWRHVIVIGKD